MPIRINFLAEHQAAEEAKRRDPAKRAQLIAVCFILLLVLWAALLQVRLMSANSEVSDVAARYKQIEAQYQLVRTNYAKATEAIGKLAALQQLATNRFLWAPPLSALQYVVVEDVQLSALRGRHSYSLTEATPAVTNSTGNHPIQAGFGPREDCAQHQKPGIYSSGCRRSYPSVPGRHREQSLLQGQP